MTTDALLRQEGGDHYKGAAIQPVEFWQRNRWDGCACSSLKYLARYKLKNGLEDLRKAKHFIELRQRFERHLNGRMPPPEIPMVQFLDANGIKDPLERETLMALEAYVYSSPIFRDAQAELVIEGIDLLIGRYLTS